MKFIEIKEDFETFDSDKGMTVKIVPAFINLDNIELIRKNKDESLSIFLIGRDKALKISDEDSVDKVCKATGINKLND